ncbi:MAG: hypothetical protein HYZ49_07095 [Chloroflexi bacterium]|nr:hypothetical protein [Chloroflexota bacterium]
MSQANNSSSKDRRQSALLRLIIWLGRIARGGIELLAFGVFLIAIMLGIWIAIAALPGSPVPSVSEVKQAAVSAQLLWRVHDELLSKTPRGRHYIDMFYTHVGEINALLDADSQLLAEAEAAIVLWQPNMQALVDGRGSEAVITAEQVQALETFLGHMYTPAGSELRAAIDREREALSPLAQFVGLTMVEAWARLNPPDSLTPMPLPTLIPVADPPAETLTLPFNTLSVMTTRGYGDSVVIEVSGVGQTAGTDYNDAFYLFTNLGNGYIRSDYLASFRINGLEMAPPPTYRDDHLYRFTFSLGATPYLITFSNSDGVLGDNSGQYAIRLWPATPGTPTPDSNATPGFDGR